MLGSLWMIAFVSCGTYAMISGYAVLGKILVFVGIIGSVILVSFISGIKKPRREPSRIDDGS
ncbi:hypothetical protein GCM10007047_13390 [Cerasicoccus arenae]|uniref:Uncharacterized protein n=1 Tax=Cerasicoccus arenae TaxID=424488 RepID=A0A8J3D9I5_9BACT|nr:hypothetical protein GCM10007047_13390 [Cerasicoccus arenae]